LCETNQGALSEFGVWADQRGVFTTFRTAICTGISTCVAGKEGQTIRFNDGSGWKLLNYRPNLEQGVSQITGFSGGPVVLTTPIEGIDYLDTTGTVTHQIDFTTEQDGVFVVNSDLAYAYDGSALLRYSAGSWSDVATLPMQYATDIWADSEVVVVTGPNQAVYIKHSADNFVPIPGVPAGDYHGLWGFSGTDLYAGNQVGQLLHYDGNSWNVVAAAPSVLPIRAIWGTGGDVYFSTALDLGVWDGQTYRILITSPVEQPVYSIMGIWGLSRTEVLVSLYDRSQRGYRCGEPFILWFDSAQFHRF
jgi:hypothetical protein